LHHNEDDRLAVDGGELHECGANLIAIDGKAGRGPIGGSFVSMSLKSGVLACSPPSQASMGIANNLQQPGSEECLIAQGSAVLPGGQQRALHNVIGRVTVSAQHASIGSQEGDLRCQRIPRETTCDAHRF
jgi:hypothetical protein